MRNLFGYRYEKEVGRAYNRNFLARRDLVGSRWVGKISKSLEGKGVNFRDLNARAVLAHRLARVLGIPVAPFKIIPAKSVAGLDLASSPQRISDAVWLSKFRGKPLPEFLKNADMDRIANLDTVWDSFVFNVWIGNYDRKDEDYLVDDSGNVTFIDYHLWGPGFHDSKLLALGAYAEGYSLDDVNDTGWCVGTPRLLSFARERKMVSRELESMMQRVETVKPWLIKLAMRGLRFSDQDNKRDINDWLFAYLLARRQLVRGAIASWIAAGYPLGKRPKNVQHDDDLYANVNS